MMTIVESISKKIKKLVDALTVSQKISTSNMGNISFILTKTRLGINHFEPGLLNEILDSIKLNKISKWRY